MSTNNSSDDLRTEMSRLGAREYEIVALGMDPDRGLAALAYALKQGADNPVAYAIKMFDKPDWQPAAASRPLRTNVSAPFKSCPHCGGDKFVLVTDGPGLWEETYAPCAHCNAQANTVRWVGDERRETAAR